MICWRCARRMDDSFFEPGHKSCKACLEKRRTYKATNADHIKQKNKEHYEAHKEEKIQYQEDHKEHIKAYRTEKINCPLCNCSVSRNGSTEHQRTGKCNKNKT